MYVYNHHQIPGCNGYTMDLSWIMGDSLPTSVEIRLMVDFASGEAPAACMAGAWLGLVSISLGNNDGEYSLVISIGEYSPSLIITIDITSTVILVILLMMVKKYRCNITIDVINVVNDGDDIVMMVL